MPEPTQHSILLLLTLLLCACFPGGVPTQTSPSCSWASAVPSDAGRLCSETFDTLSAIVRAEIRGDDRTIHRLVVTPSVAARIIAYGATLRGQKIVFLHVVPSLTLDELAPGSIGAGFFLIGRTGQGSVNAPQTVYLQIRHGSAIVVHDQPNQEW